LERTFISLACADNGIGVESLAWTSWTDTTATATGRLWNNNCTPDCMEGTVPFYPASITLSDAHGTAVGPLFGELTARFEGTGPNGQSSEQFALPVPPA
jgi:hypothetical protein